jgi:hypothetical protein
VQIDRLERKIDRLERKIGRLERKIMKLEGTAWYVLVLNPFFGYLKDLGLQDSDNDSCLDDLASLGDITCT